MQEILLRQHLASLLTVFAPFDERGGRTGVASDSGVKSEKLLKLKGAVSPSAVNVASSKPVLRTHYPLP